MADAPANDHGLTGELAAIAEVIGVAKALQLAAALGGDDVYFAKRPNPDNPVVKAIGKESALKLADYAGSGSTGGTLYVPRATATNRAARNAKIVADVDDGLSKRKAAQRHNLTTRQVRTICNRENDRHPGQGKLFG